jgi:hypothetical protein
MIIKSTVKGPEVTSIEDLNYLQLRLTMLVEQHALPLAKTTAPTGVGESLTVAPTRMIGAGSYSVGLSIPRRYKWTEVGSGIYVGNQPWMILPLKAKALQLSNGAIVSSAEVYGQRAQHYMRDALEQTLPTIMKELVNDITRRLSSRGAA